MQVNFVACFFCALALVCANATAGSSASSCQAMQQMDVEDSGSESDMVIQMQTRAHVLPQEEPAPPATQHAAIASATSDMKGKAGAVGQPPVAKDMKVETSAVGHQPVTQDTFVEPVVVAKAAAEIEVAERSVHAVGLEEMRGRAPVMELDPTAVKSFGHKAWLQTAQLWDISLPLHITLMVVAVLGTIILFYICRKLLHVVGRKMMKESKADAEGNLNAEAKLQQLLSALGFEAGKFEEEAPPLLGHASATNGKPKESKESEMQATHMQTAAEEELAAEDTEDTEEEPEPAGEPEPESDVENAVVAIAKKIATKSAQTKTTKGTTAAKAAKQMNEIKPPMEIPLQVQVIQV